MIFSPCFHKNFKNETVGLKFTNWCTLLARRALCTSFILSAVYNDSVHAERAILASNRCVRITECCQKDIKGQERFYSEFGASQGLCWRTQVNQITYFRIILGCVPLGWSGSGSLIRDHSDHGRSNDPMNPCSEWIHRFIWSTMIRVNSDHWSWSGSSQRNAPLECPL